MSRRPLELLCVAPYVCDSAPSQRFRIEQWAPALEACGVRTSFLHFSDEALDWARRRGDRASLVAGVVARYPSWTRELIARARDADLVMVPIKSALAGPPIGEALLRALGRPFVFDVDDAHHVRALDSSSVIADLVRCDWRIPYVGRWASLVTAGNAYLADYYARLNDHVAVWPTTVTMARYTERAPHRRADLPVVGWTGSPSTVMYLRDMLPLLATIQRAIPFELYVFGAEIDLGPVRGRCEPWRREREVEAVQEMDVGIMPLRDDPWSKGKCGFKAIQYLSVGVPAIVSDVGVNATIVTDEECGLVVSTDRQWRAALTRLLTERATRERMGRGGRARVAALYSTEARAPRMAHDLIETARRVASRAR